MSLLYDFIGLFFPRICYSCNNTLLQHEEVLCTFCLYQLPKTNFHLEEENHVFKNFWGRANISHATALYYFQKGSKVQHLIHQLKYKGKQEIGFYLGKTYGQDLLQSDFYKDVDIVIPVPLHPRKKRKRGYNQSESFAMGLASSMKISCDTKTLVRTTASQTQTKKSRFKRWENVKEIFAVKNIQHLQNKHILLVDDVITTGATIEACANKLFEIPGIKISVAAIACTVK